MTTTDVKQQSKAKEYIDSVFNQLKNKYGSSNGIFTSCRRNIFYH